MFSNPLGTPLILYQYLVVWGMAQNTSISLDDHFADFLSREVASGRYRSVSEVVRAGLRLLEDRETELAALRSALVAGEDSGEPEPFDFAAFITAKKAETRTSADS